jgi:DNA-directed RNA polymerase specialized sigma24 family protein
VTFDEWANQHSGSLQRFAAVLCGSRELVEEVVQDALVKAHTRWDVILAAARPDSYIRRMVVNEYLNWRREWSRIVPRSEITLTDHQADPAVHHADRDEQRAPSDDRRRGGRGRCWGWGVRGLWRIWAVVPERIGYRSPWGGLRGPRS